MTITNKISRAMALFLAGAVSFMGYNSLNERAIGNLERKLTNAEQYKERQELAYNLYRDSLKDADIKDNAREEQKFKPVLPENLENHSKKQKALIYILKKGNKNYEKEQIQVNEILNELSEKYACLKNPEIREIYMAGVYAESNFNKELITISSRELSAGYKQLPLNPDYLEKLRGKDQKIDSLISKKKNLIKNSKWKAKMKERYEYFKNTFNNGLDFNALDERENLEVGLKAGLKHLEMRSKEITPKNLMDTIAYHQGYRKPRGSSYKQAREYVREAKPTPTAAL